MYERTDILNLGREAVTRNKGFTACGSKIVKLLAQGWETPSNDTSASTVLGAKEPLQLAPRAGCVQLRPDRCLTQRPRKQKTAAPSNQGAQDWQPRPTAPFRAGPDTPKTPECGVGVCSGVRRGGLWEAEGHETWENTKTLG